MKGIEASTNLSIFKTCVEAEITQGIDNPLEEVLVSLQPAGIQIVSSVQSARRLH